MDSKIKLGILTFSLMGLLFLMGCDPLAESKKDFYTSTESINLSEENVNSIILNSTENDVIEAFGKPLSVSEVTKPKSKYLTYNGIEFEMTEDKVNRFYFNTKYRTAKGITVGDTKDDVIQAYGKNFYERVESGQDTIGYFDKDNRINLEIGFKENKIVLVIIEKARDPKEEKRN